MLQTTLKYISVYQAQLTYRLICQGISSVHVKIPNPNYIYLIYADYWINVPKRRRILGLGGYCNSNETTMSLRALVIKFFNEGFGS
jgi:hypothetical protein